MKSLGFLWLLFFTASAQSSFDYEQEWEKFKDNYFRQYTSQEEEEYRKDIFFKRLEEIEIHNMKYELGLTPYENHIDNYADYTHLEIQKLQDYLVELQKKVQYSNGNRPHLKVNVLISICSLGFIGLKIVKSTVL